MNVLIIMFDPVICKTPNAPLHFFAKYYMHLSGNLVSFLTVELL